MSSHASPSVKLAVEAIRDQIRSGRFKSGSFLPPETGLAADLELSRGTIRRAIDVLVGTGEISRRPNSRPRIEFSKSAPTFDGAEVRVWISHPIADGATLHFLRGISYGLMGTSLRMVVREPSRFFADHVKSEERQFLTELLDSDSVCHAIVERDADANNDDLYLKLADRGKNIVFVDTPPPDGVSADYVGAANLSASRKCVEHLLQLGHKHIVYITESGHPYTVRERIKGYSRAMTQAGMEDHISILVAGHLESAGDIAMPLGGIYAHQLSPSLYYEAACKKLIRRILSMDPRPTAIVASCDVLAIWTCAFLEGSGWSIPEDFAVVGFDWLSRWDDPAHDTLTSASQDFEGFGYHAAECILDRAQGAERPEPKWILMPAPLQIRSSTVETPITAPDTSGAQSRNRVHRFR